MWRREGRRLCPAGADCCSALAEKVWNETPVGIAPSRDAGHPLRQRFPAYSIEITVRSPDWEACSPGQLASTQGAHKGKKRCARNLRAGTLVQASNLSVTFCSASGWAAASVSKPKAAVRRQGLGQKLRFQPFHTHSLETIVRIPRSPLRVRAHG